MRQGVDGPDELVGGVSRRRAKSCSPIAALILGSVEAAAFTGDQLRMIAEFVDRRGGGLLMLGGPRAFAEGGYAARRSPSRCRWCSIATSVQAEGHRDAPDGEADARRQRRPR